MRLILGLSLTTTVFASSCGGDLNCLLDASVEKIGAALEKVMNHKGEVKLVCDGTNKSPEAKIVFQQSQVEAGMLGRFYEDEDLIALVEFEAHCRGSTKEVDAACETLMFSQDESELANARGILREFLVLRGMFDMDLYFASPLFVKIFGRENGVMNEQVLFPRAYCEYICYILVNIYGSVADYVAYDEQSDVTVQDLIEEFMKFMEGYTLETSDATHQGTMFNARLSRPVKFLPSRSGSKFAAAFQPVSLMEPKTWLETTSMGVRSPLTKRSRWVLWVGVSVMSLVLVAAIVMFSLRRSKSVNAEMHEQMVTTVV